MPTWIWGVLVVGLVLSTYALICSIVYVSKWDERS